MGIKKEPSKGQIRAFLGEGTEFEGLLHFDGTVRVDGMFKGEVRSNDCLIIGETGFVEGEIMVGHLIVMGAFKGNVKAANKIEVLSTGRITGTISSPMLMVQEGGVLDGNIAMKGADEQAAAKIVSLHEARQETSAAKQS
ncbi:MAG: polymer-forming cytoskeletal protein [Nitrospinae bacterium]|nr:polymer-forming cytoskeletal protein [Nitrospinota bacterium]